MSADPNWTRWFFASAAFVLRPIASDNDWPVLVEHLEERTQEFMQASNRAEIRITGPVVHQYGPGCFRIDLDVNVLLTSRFDGQNKNAYDIHYLAGLFQEAMGNPIPAWNYGNRDGDFVDDDPDSHISIGCFLPRNDKGDEAVRVFHFGQINPTDKQKQTVVDARYTMFL